MRYFIEADVDLEHRNEAIMVTSEFSLRLIEQGRKLNKVSVRDEQGLTIFEEAYTSESRKLLQDQARATLMDADVLGD